MNKIFRQIFPGWIKKQIFNTITHQIRENNSIQSSQIPRHKIQPETIENTKLLLNREELLKLLPKQATVAELGVDEGIFSELILSTCNPHRLHLVDFWGSKRYSQNKKKIVENKFKSQIKSGQIEINLGYSIEVGKKFQDNYFDWIYIDTDHSYQMTISELETWKSKVKDRGIIAGHDYIVGNWNGMVRYGVIEAIYEFCSKYNWEILYLTMEIEGPPSFAIRKLEN